MQKKNTLRIKGKCKMNKKRLIGVILAGGMMLSTMTACIRPYDTPEFVEIQPNQTAFVIPLEGKTSDQGQFDSERYLEEMQVATKRIQVPHKWVQTGRRDWKGEWVDTVKVIVVDRTPVNREWFNDASRSSSGLSQGFTGESKDSIKFLIGLTATAKIMESDTAKFLYQYSGKDLATVMDTEIRNKLGTILLEKYGSMSMDEIRTKKAEVIEHVRSIAIPYFKEYGITLENVGYVGDLEYVDPAVQRAINEAFNAEQKQKAIVIQNETKLSVKENEKAIAEVEKQTLEIRKSVMKETIELRELDIQEQWIEKWDGRLPQTTTGEGSGVMLNLKK